MSRKTFISYKHSEAQGLRDGIIRALGPGATYYRGETSASPDLTDYTTTTIKEHLKDMIFDTSVTIVIISPHMKESKWIDWEIEYSLTENSRHGRTSKSNGVVGVVMKYCGGYNWFRDTQVYLDGHREYCFHTGKVFDIISRNRSNKIGCTYVRNPDRSADELTRNYISFVDEETFLADPGRYIENAYDKCRNIDRYKISKVR